MFLTRATRAPSLADASSPKCQFALQGVTTGLSGEQIITNCHYL